ncbi:hypothetical protein FB451DRAFT_1568739 [Mycena latifolia]|nr:hypothetical protein FB451DRAFT_1568739 [Mycena latifolia]
MDVYHSEFSMLPLRMLQTRFCGRKFCQEIDEVTLTETQIGKIRLLLYMDPNYPDHENPALTKIFNAALPRVAQILAEFDDTHPVIASCNKYFSSDLKTKKKEKPEVSNWRRILGLVPTPELEAVLLDPLELLIHPDLAHLLEPERNKRVMGVGSVLFQILGIQQELGEELNLNGDLIHELVDGSVVPCQHDGALALERMFAAIPLPSAKSAVLVKRMLRFNTAHSIFDPTLRPPTYRLFLWVLWLATGAHAAQATTALRILTGCGSEAEAEAESDSIDFGDGVSVPTDDPTAGICPETSAIVAFAFLNWILLLGYTATLPLGARAVGVGSWPLLGIAPTLAFAMSELILLCSIVPLHISVWQSSVADTPFDATPSSPIPRSYGAQVNGSTVTVKTGTVEV